MHHSFDLESAILDILYQKCIDRPLWVSDSEVYWLIPNMNVTERDVREMLEHLVFHRRVLKQVGKYQISKAEFLSIKERIEMGEVQENYKQADEKGSQGDGSKSENETKGITPQWSMLFIYSYQRLWRVVLFSLIGVLLVCLGVSWYNIYEKERSIIDPIELRSSHIISETTSSQVIPDLRSITRTDLVKDHRLLSNDLEQSRNLNNQVDSLLQTITKSQSYIIHQSLQMEEQIRSLKCWVIAEGIVLLFLCMLLTWRGLYFFCRNRR